METPILPMCYLHKTQPLNWVCLENSCEKRLFCSHCIIFNHKEVHKNFNEISHILNDPLSQLLSSNHLKNSKTSDSLLEIVTKFAQKEEDKLTDLYNQIITEISKKFDEIRMSFHEDLIKFIKENEKNIELIDSQRKEYLKFCSNYFTKAVFENRDNLKEGLDLILSKFHSDNNLQKLFDGTVKSLPQVNIDKPLDLAIGLKKLNEIKWSFFTDKILSRKKIYFFFLLAIFLKKIFFFFWQFFFIFLIFNFLNFLIN